MPLAHESLVAWKRADELFIRIHQLSQTFPSHERFELGSQSRRAAFSVAANIVEGFGRSHRRNGRSSCGSRSRPWRNSPTASMSRGDWTTSPQSSRTKSTSTCVKSPRRYGDYCEQRPRAL